ncbi:leucine-rich repeat flightless-interacting protein 1 isoform 4-T5 [Rhinophrynus dorsalis]
MGTQGPGRKRHPNREKLSAEDHALNQIAREAEARLAAKRAARAEAREIRMKELERQQKEIYQVQKEDSERYSHRTRRNLQASDEDDLMSVGSRSSLRTNGYEDELLGAAQYRKSSRSSTGSGETFQSSRGAPRDEPLSTYYSDSLASAPLTSKPQQALHNGNRPSLLNCNTLPSRSQRGSVYDEGVTSGSRRYSSSSSRPTSEYSCYLGSGSRASSRASSARASPVSSEPPGPSAYRRGSAGGSVISLSHLDNVAVPSIPRVEERPDKDFSEKGSRPVSSLSAATLASLGGTTSRRGSGDTSISVDTEASIREIKEISELKDQIDDVEGRYMQGLKEMKDSLAEVEEKYKRSMVTNAQLDNEKSSLQYQVDMLRDVLLELEEELAESRRQYEEKHKECERQKHEHNILRFQLAELKDALEKREEMLTEIRQLQQKQESSDREICDLQETIEWKDKKIGALERQKEFFDPVRSERDELREEVTRLREELKKHGIALDSEGTPNGDASLEPQVIEECQMDPPLKAACLGKSKETEVRKEALSVDGQGPPPVSGQDRKVAEENVPETKQSREEYQENAPQAVHGKETAQENVIEVKQGGKAAQEYIPQAEQGKENAPKNVPEAKQEGREETQENTPQAVQSKEESCVNDPVAEQLIEEPLVEVPGHAESKGIIEAQSGEEMANNLKDVELGSEVYESHSHTDFETSLGRQGEVLQPDTKHLSSEGKGGNDLLKDDIGVEEAILGQNLSEVDGEVTPNHREDSPVGSEVFQDALDSVTQISNSVGECEGETTLLVNDVKNEEEGKTCQQMSTIEEDTKSDVQGTTSDYDNIQDKKRGILESNPKDLSVLNVNFDPTNLGNEEGCEDHKSAKEGHVSCPSSKETNSDSEESFESAGGAGEPPASDGSEVDQEHIRVCGKTEEKVIESPQSECKQDQAMDQSKDLELQRSPEKPHVELTFKESGKEVVCVNEPAINTDRFDVSVGENIESNKENLDEIHVCPALEQQPQATRVPEDQVFLLEDCKERKVADTEESCLLNQMENIKGENEVQEVKLVTEDSRNQESVSKERQKDTGAFVKKEERTLDEGEEKEDNQTQKVGENQSETAPSEALRSEVKHAQEAEQDSYDEDEDSNAERNDSYQGENNLLGLQLGSSVDRSSSEDVSTEHSTDKAMRRGKGKNKEDCVIS